MTLAPTNEQQLPPNQLPQPQEQLLPPQPQEQLQQLPDQPQPVINELKTQTQQIINGQPQIQQVVSTPDVIVPAEAVVKPPSPDLPLEGVNIHAKYYLYYGNAL